MRVFAGGVRYEGTVPEDTLLFGVRSPLCGEPADLGCLVRVRPQVSV